MADNKPVEQDPIIKKRIDQFGPFLGQAKQSFVGTDRIKTHFDDGMPDGVEIDIIVPQALCAGILFRAVAEEQLRDSADKVDLFMDSK